MRLFNTKKGVSPLIATVLLIAFAVALGAVVMNWGRGYAEDLQDTAQDNSDSAIICNSDVHPQIVAIDSINQVCVSNDDPGAGENTVNLIIQNSPRRDIDHFEMRIIGSASKVPIVVDLGNSSALPNGAAKLYNYTYDATEYGNVSQVLMTPYITHGGREIRCNSQQIKAINLPTCSAIGW